MIKDHDEFRKLIAKRNSGNITCNFKRIYLEESENKNLKEKFAEEIGYKSNEIKDSWKQVDKDRAKKIIEYILSIDMAYDLKLETKPYAAELSRYFLNQFGLSAKYFTNGNFDKEFGFLRLRSWKPISNSTFDTGILAQDENIIGILWAEDDD